MTAQPEPAPDPVAELGYRDATRIITAQYAAGVGLDKIAAHHDDISARLLSDAQTAAGRAYASEYDSTSRTLIADLCADEAEAARPRPPEGTPHPDAAMAELGWHTSQHGIYVKDGQAGAADVAALERYAGSLRDADREAG